MTGERLEEVLSANPDCKGVIVTSPSYYGITSDIEELAKVAHSHDCILIVDQAHGAHLKMTDPELAADGKGADIVIASTHKTLASFTQTAVVNIYGDRVSLDVLNDKMQMIESSSPSYMLMASLDMNIEILEKAGDELAARWKENLDYFYSEAEKIEGIEVLKHPLCDRTKIVLNSEGLGISGDELDARLREQGIFLELTSGNLAMGMTGIGNVREDYDRLLAELKSVSECASSANSEKSKTALTVTEYIYKRREQREIPTEWERLHNSRATGRVSAASIIPYPPGIPMIAPGEVMDRETLEYAMDLRRSGAKVIGIDEEGFLQVGKDEVENNER